MEFSVLIINSSRNPKIKRNLERYFSSNDLNCRIEELTNGEEIDQLYARYTPDLVFLDDDQSAMALSDKIRSLEDSSTIVLITDNEDIRREEFQNHLDGILYRPLEEEAINALLNTSIEKMKRDLKLHMFKYENKMVIISYKDIFYFQKQLSGVKIYSKRGEFKFKERFNNLMETLDRSDFIMCHKDYIINLKKIESASDNSCRLHFIDHEIPISGKFKTDIFKILDKKLHM
ncbi:MAG: LytTR family transcriptional regulator DNA-binding domain-containing protein [Dethiosulfatibacter sp.]|nr:LytTR family transcriptional regulator DNA-binding domain-containing protein [Dethiosulfatibacter sp.]